MNHLSRRLFFIATYLLGLQLFFYLITLVGDVGVFDLSTIDANMHFYMVLFLSISGAIISAFVVKFESALFNPITGFNNGSIIRASLLYGFVFSIGFALALAFGILSMSLIDGEFLFALFLACVIPLCSIALTMIPAVVYSLPFAVAFALLQPRNSNAHA
jgi:hypothetical protein